MVARDEALGHGRGRYLGLAGVGAVILAAASSGGCYDIRPASRTVELSIDKAGMVTAEQLGVTGQWYVYGDAYGSPASCMDVGKHERPFCSRVTYPETHLPELNFPNDGGKMCISGVVAQVLFCCTQDVVDQGLAGCEEVNETNCRMGEPLDHSSMWGAGMGFDLTLDPPRSGDRDYEAIAKREPWDAALHDVRGISFDLEWHAAGDPPIRVAFPMFVDEEILLPPDQGTVRLVEDGSLEFIAPGEPLPAGFSTEEHPYGSPFYQRQDETEWRRSPVVQGPNTILWGDVLPPPEPEDNYLEQGEFVGQQLLGIQFQVVPDSEGAKDLPFSFCISNLKFLLD